MTLTQIDEETFIPTVLGKESLIMKATPASGLSMQPSKESLESSVRDTEEIIAEREYMALN